jgi:hypothetical protein
MDVSITSPTLRRSMDHEANFNSTAQSTQAQPNGEAAAMSTQAGTVVGFDATQVYKGKNPNFSSSKGRMLIKNSGFERCINLYREWRRIEERICNYMFGRWEDEVRRGF